MKAALVIYGHMRTYRIAFPGLKKIFIDEYDPDIFIHTWDKVEATTKTWHNERMKEAPLDVKEVVEMYSPKEIMVETQPQVDDDRVTPNNNISYIGQKFMLESLKKADELRQNSGTEYDIVMKIRPDIKLIKPIDIGAPRMGVVPTGSNLRGSNRTACDIINVAVPEDMTWISAAVDHFDEFYVDRPLAGKLQHSGFIDYVASLGLEVEWMPYHYQNHWNIVRRKDS